MKKRFYVRYSDNIVKDKDLWEINKGNPFGKAGREVFDDNAPIVFDYRIYEGDWIVFDKYGAYKIVPFSECTGFYISESDEDMTEVSCERFKAEFCAQWR